MGDKFAHGLPTVIAVRQATAENFRQRAAQGLPPALVKGGAWWEPQAKARPALELTAVQAKAERQEKKAERHIESQADPAVRQQSAITAATNPAFSLLQLGLQLLVVLGLSIIFHSSLVLLEGVMWISYSLIRRRQDWGRFLFGMAILLLVARLLGKALI